MKRLLGFKTSVEERDRNSSSNQRFQQTESVRRDPGRARHSVAVSSCASQTDREITRQPHLPSSRSHAHISRNSFHPANQISKRSISASYISKAPSQQQRFPASRTTGLYGYGRSLVPPAATPEKPKTRIEKITTKIHQKLDLSSYLDWPADKWMEIQEYFELMDWDELGYTFGVALNGAHLLIRFLSGLESIRRNHMGEKHTNKSWFSFGFVEAMSMCSFLMCIYSCYNSYAFFTARRAYQLHHREDMVNSPNVTLVQSPTAPQEEPPSWREVTLSLLRRFSSACIGWPNSEINQLPKPTQVYQLNMSQIDPVRLKVFIVYPPPQAFLMHFANFSESCFHWVLLMAVLIYQNYFVVNYFSQLVKDKEIIQAEVMHEYNVKFVYPKAFPLTREAATMTSSAEFVRREDWMSY